MRGTCTPFSLGSFRCCALQDRADDIDANFNPLFVATDQYKIIVDPGLGSDMFPGMRDHSRLPERLRELGIAPTDIDLVVFTHADFDHVCGGVAAGGTAAFANARYILLREEWDFWATRPERMRPDAAFDSEFRRLCNEVPPARLTQIQDRLRLVADGTEIVPGVRLLAAAGHTPGHACISFTAGESQLLFVGDLFYNPEEIADPGWFSVFDFDPPQAIVTRHRVFTAAARSRTLLMGFHLPFPGLGYISRQDHGWAWTAAYT